MKNKAVLLTTILLLLMGFVAQPAKAVGASGVTIYVVPTITNDKILPTTVVSRHFISNKISIVASPGEYEPASFVIRANGDIQSLQIEATDLAGVTSSIPSSNVNIRVVECWWQSGREVFDTTQKLLTPELLLKDDSLVKVENGENYLKLTSGQYVWISERKNDPIACPAIKAKDFPVNDSLTLQPVSISSGDNKQFWVTLKVPEEALPGVYEGEVDLRTSAGIVGQLQLELEVLPIELLGPCLITSISHYSYPGPGGYLCGGERSEAAYRAELNDLLAYGVTNPTCFTGGAGWDEQRMAVMLRIRNEVGMGGQPLYSYSVAGNPTDPAGLATLKAKVESLIALAKSYGVPEVYIYSSEEAAADSLVSQRPAWETVHQAGGKVWYAGYEGTFELVGDLLDLFRVGYAPDPQEAEKWHSVGHQIFSYGNPQGGVEEPETYRRNYGLLLWQGDYDGGMTCAYSSGMANIWNDFDNTVYRDHCMAYPTIDGVIDTIQWEGFREGVDDLRYLNTLLRAIEKAKANGKDTSVIEGWLADLKDSKLAMQDSDAVRSKMIGHILSLVAGAPSDVTPPGVAAVGHSVLTSPLATTTITWTTDERATSQVEYGKTAGLGLSTVLDASLVRSHEVVLVGLDENSTYYFRVKSQDASGNLAVSDVCNLSTLPSSSISFVPPTDADMTVISRNWTALDASISSTHEASSFIDWNRSLVGYWDFNENSGSTARDKSTYGNTATLKNSPQWAGGKFGNALKLDGADDYVDCGNSTSLDIADAITVEFWVKPTDFVGDQMILSKVEGARAKGYWCYLIGEYIYFAVGKGTDYQEWNVEAPLSMIGAGEWTHIVGTFAANDRIVIYVNGVEIDGKAVTGGIASTTANLCVSRYSGWFLDGLVDEIRIWNRVLSPEEIKASYNTNTYSLSHKFANLTDGTYRYYAYTTDAVGNSTRTETRTVTVNTSGHPGDANGDGAVNVADITCVERIIAGLEGPTSGADANGDGVVNVADITKIERIIAGLS